MERFLRPKWIVSHVFVVLLVVAMIVAGFWQLGRYNDRRDTNDQVTERLEQPLVDIRDIVSVDDPFSVGDDVRFRLASATTRVSRSASTRCWRSEWPSSPWRCSGW